MRRIVVLMAGVVLVVSASPMISAPAAHADSWSDAMAFVGAINGVRASRGVAPLAVDVRLDSLASWWAGRMAAAGGISHNPNLGAMLPAGWTIGGENVGFGGNVATLEYAFEHSPEHLANMVNPLYSTIGVGVVWVGSIPYVSEEYMGGVPAIAPQPPAPPMSFLRNSLTPGFANISFGYGSGGDVTLSCAWAGNGVDTPAVFRGGMWYIRMSNTSGVANVAMGFGDPGDVPVCGDWDGNGTGTPGIYRNGVFYLRNSLTTGVPDVVVRFGNPGDIPLALRWTRGGAAMVGLFRPNNATFYLRSNNGPGVPAVTTVALGDAGDRPLVGDWNGAGVNTIGVFRPPNATFYLANANHAGAGITAVAYGMPSDTPVVGDWTGLGHDTIGIVR
jgi:hypothetical protein